MDEGHHGFYCPLEETSASFRTKFIRFHLFVYFVLFKVVDSEHEVEILFSRLTPSRSSSKCYINDDNNN